MHPLWLIEEGVYGREAEPLLAEIRRQAMTAQVVPYRALTRGPAPAEAEACVVGYGTFPFARQIQLHHAWKPGGWCSPDRLDCAAYFAHFGRYLLNSEYAILPGVEAIRLRDWLFAVFGKDGAVFVRPTSCHKLFVGRCVSRADFDAALAPTRYDPATLVVVAAPRPIEREWRLVVAGNQLVAGSRYAVGGVRDVAPDCPAEVQAFVAELLREVSWRPDPVFMLDVAASEGRLRLVELNGFSCSWLYACDLAAVVRAVGELAAQAHHSTGTG